jgi:mRNA-degrading endonuclease toxin of MazEF toxin-antitoxin module
MPAHSSGKLNAPIAERGQIYHVDLDPTAGHEQSGFRPILVVTQKLFNTSGTPIVCPITHGGAYARNRGFAVELAGTKTHGVVLCHQLRALDLQARNARYIEIVPEEILDEVMARIAAILE